MSFTTLGLDPSLLATLTALGYTLPTPVQLEAIPAARSTARTIRMCVPQRHKFADNAKLISSRVGRGVRASSFNCRP